MARLAAHQDASHRPGIADAGDEVAAPVFGGRQVGQVGAVALAGVHHQHAGGTAGGEHLGGGADRGAKLRHVVAEGGAETARFQEVALHVDDDERCS